MIRINELKLSLDDDESKLKILAAKALKIPESRIESLSIAKKSVDSRKKNNLHFVYSVDVTVSGNEEKVLAKSGCKKALVVEPFSYSVPENKRNGSFRPVVAGFGPGGMFAALNLARAGAEPIVLERGSDVDTRQKDVDTFWSTKKLNKNSNVQFGEGGAGTFSDGKLTTGIKDPLCRQVFLDFVDFGADKDILYSALPHIGTDKLCKIAVLRDKLLIAALLDDSSAVKDKYPVAVADSRKPVSYNYSCAAHFVKSLADLLLRLVVKS